MYRCCLLGNGTQMEVRGSERYRFPVSRAKAFTTAGEVMGVAGSPTPKGASSLGTICTSIIAGASDM